MSIYVGIGFSQNANTAKAAREAALEAKIQTQFPSVNFALVFTTIHYSPQETLIAVRQTLGQEAKIIGCSTAGVILSELIEMRGIAVLVISSDDMQFGIGSVFDLTGQNSRQAGSLLARNTINNFGTAKRQAFLFFTDGLLKNSAPIIKGFQEVLGTVFPIVGAGSSDDFHFKKTYQYMNDQVMTSGATGLLLGGQFHFGIGSKHGWKPLGKPRTVDHVDGHIIKTIDGKKASGIYEEYFGEAAQDLRSQLSQMAILYPLGVYMPEENEYLLRNAIDILHDGSIVCQGEVPEGSEVHLMIGNKDSCKQAAVEAALEIRETLLGKEPKLIIIFESLARHKLLGRGAFKEIQMIKEVFGHDVPIIGMYSYGEIAPFHSSDHVKKTHLQNLSIVMLGIA